MKRPRKQRGWREIKPLAISDPRVDVRELPPGQQAKLVPFTELLDEDGMRWVDHHDGKGPIWVGGVPPITKPR